MNIEIYQTPNKNQATAIVKALLVADISINEDTL